MAKFVYRMQNILNLKQMLETQKEHVGVSVGNSGEVELVGQKGVCQSDDVAGEGSLEFLAV